MAAAAPASQGGQRGNASRRRPSVDWPLSRDEKKYQALQLYEQDVQTCNHLLKDKDKALRKAKEQIKELRRTSLASQDEIKQLRRASLASTTTTTTGGCSTPDELHADDVDDANAASKSELETVGSAGCRRRGQPQDVPAEQEPAQTRHPTSRRSNSLETVSSWFECAKPQAQPSNGRTASPRRMNRSGSLEGFQAASSWFAPAWKAVRNGARQATETAKETAKLIADEARLVTVEVRDLLVVDSLPHDTPSDVVAPASKPAARVPPPAEYMEWRVDLELDTEDVGLKLEPYVHGQRRRVHSVSQGSAIDVWNSCKAPVTVFLHPGGRERVTRMVVRPGDELVAIDEEQLELLPDDDKNLTPEVEACKTLSFRRKVHQRVPADAGGA